MRRDSVGGRVLGILVFLVGIAILIGVAVVTYRLFNTSAAALKPTSGAANGAVAQLGNSAIKMLYRIALLIVMCIVGSLLAARGLHLYFVATGSAVTHDQGADGG